MEKMPTLFKKSSTESKNSAARMKQPKQTRYTTQELIPLKGITRGMICLTDGRYLRVLEIEPTNYYQLPVEEQNSIISAFAGLFRSAPAKLQFKTITRRIDPSIITERVRRINQKSDSTKIRIAANDYIQMTESLSDRISEEKKYYIIFEYEGDSNGNRSGKIDEVYDAMHIQYLDLCRRVESCGNKVVSHDDENMFLLQFLYEFYNQKSCISEPLAARIKRLDSDRKRCAEEQGKKLGRPDLADYVAPRGVNFGHNRDFFMMDGMYYTYLALTDEGYPSRVEAGWMDLLFGNYGIGVDFDFYMKRLPRDATRYAIEKTTSLRRVSASEHSGDVSKFNSLMQQAQNGEFIATKLREGEDIYDCSLIITIWNENPKHLLQMREIIKKDLQSRDLEVEDSHYDCASYFRMAAPLLNIQNDIMQRTGHNFLTSSLPSIYNYTAFQMFDQGGFVLGQNLQTGSVVAINPFNTHTYKNANIVIAGTSGSGKTFTELLMGRRAFLSGLGTYYILPVKGEEYRDAVLSLNGQYIMLQPGSKACINIMEIRPENAFITDGTESGQEKNEQSRPLLAKKIQSLSVFIELLQSSGDAPLTSSEKNKLNALLMEVYGQFGINNDNNSIYDEDGNLKQMPTLSMLYYALLEDTELKRLATLLIPFVQGSCRNLDGQTNVNLKNRCIAFDVNEDNIGKDLLPALMYIAFDCVYDLVKGDKDNFDMIFLDEVWKMMTNKACAEQVKSLVKLIRGYGGGVIMATQDLYDFTNDPGGFGVAVLNNTKIKLILQLEHEEVGRVAELMKLTPNDKANIVQFSRGSGMLLSNNVKILVRMVATDLETKTFTTDLNVKKKIRQEELGRAPGLFDA